MSAANDALVWILGFCDLRIRRITRMIRTLAKIAYAIINCGIIALKGLEGVAY